MRYASWASNQRASKCNISEATPVRRYPGAGAEVRVTLVEPESAPHLSQNVVGKHGVEGIAVFAHDSMPLLDRDLYGDIMSIPEEDGRAMARRVARSTGMLIGGSSGLNLSAAVKVATARGPNSVVVTVLVDTGLKYLAGSLFE